MKINRKNGDDMEARLPCDRHDEQIKNLARREEAIREEMSAIKNDMEDMTDLKIAIKTMSVSMEYMVEHNKRQDLLNERQNQTLENINENLNELNDMQRSLNDNQKYLDGKVDKNKKYLDEKVKKLEDKIYDNECKHTIDIRDIEKSRYVDVIIKYALPASGGIIVLCEIIKILKQ